MEVHDLHEVGEAEALEAMDQMVALENAARFELLQLISLYNNNEWWKSDASSMNEWIRTHYAIDSHLASDLVRVSAFVEDLPNTFTGFATGQISWDQLTVVTRFVTPEEDEEWAEHLKNGKLSTVRAAARLRKPPEPNDATDAWDKRSLRLIHRRNGGFGLIGNWADDSGAVIERAINCLTDRSYSQMEDPAKTSLAQRQADALVEMALTFLGSEASEVAKPAIIIHVDAAVLGGDTPGVAEIENGTTIDAVVARHLACDAKVQLSFDGRDGKPVGIGRQAHDPPWWLVRRIKKRDKNWKPRSICCGASPKAPGEAEVGAR